MREGAFELLTAAREGDAEAAGRMVEENSGLIWSVARRYFGRGVDPEDLFQLGCVGFLKAVRGFDESYGTRFSTYAVPKIAGEIRRFLRDDGPVKVSRGVKERAMAVRRAQQELEQRLGREPVLSELAEATGFTPEDIAALETASAPARSLQQESGDDGAALESVLGDWGQEERFIERMALREAVAQLPEKERMTVLLRYWRGMTQDAAARVLGVSQVQVSRLEKRAVARLRELLAE